MAAKKKLPRITFKRKEKETGLAAVGAGPRGFDVKVDGRAVGHIYARGGDWRGPFQGWYYVLPQNAVPGSPHVNTSDAKELYSTEDEVKDAVKKHLVEFLEKSHEG